jgi:hypothetical protein
MNTPAKSILRWSSILGYFVILSLMPACMRIAVGSANVTQGTLRLEDGAVQAQDQHGDWVAVANTSTFELVGVLESINPWKVSDKTLQTNESTQIATGLQTGQLVRVRGTILDDDTWLAYSIEPAEQQADHSIILIGVVTSIDPWVVNGITLNVTSDTVINGEIKTGMLARVEILLSDDGTWDVISISPLSSVPPASGCATIIATVVSVNGNEIQFLGWPTTVTVQADTKSVNDDENKNGNGDEDDDEQDDEDNDEGGEVATVHAGQLVVVTVCASDTGQLVVVKIIVVQGDNDTSEGGQKVLVCHKPDKKGGHTLSISSSAVPAHLAHGDKLGACP